MNINLLLCCLHNQLFPHHHYLDYDNAKKLYCYETPDYYAVVMRTKCLRCGKTVTYTDKFYKRH